MKKFQIYTIGLIIGFVHVETDPMPQHYAPTMEIHF
jgi:hypothetical protein